MANTIYDANAYSSRTPSPPTTRDLEIRDRAPRAIGEDTDQARDSDGKSRRPWSTDAGHRLGQNDAMYLYRLVRSNDELARRAPSQLLQSEYDSSISRPAAGKIGFGCPYVRVYCSEMSYGMGRRLACSREQRQGDQLRHQPSKLPGRVAPCQKPGRSRYQEGSPMIAPDISTS